MWIAPSPRLLRFGGDVREIARGRDFIHALFHLDRPSVTIRIASFEDPRHLFDVRYLPPGLRVDAAAKGARTEGRRRALTLLAAAWPGEYPAAVGRYARTYVPDVRAVRLDEQAYYAYEFPVASAGAADYRSAFTPESRTA